MIDNKVEDKIRDISSSNSCFTLICALVLSACMGLYLLLSLVVPYVECRGIKSLACDKFHSRGIYKTIEGEASRYRR